MASESLPSGWKPAIAVMNSETDPEKFVNDYWETDGGACGECQFFQQELEPHGEWTNRCHVLDPDPRDKNITFTDCLAWQEKVA